MTDHALPETESVREEAGLHLHWQGRRSYKSLIPVPRVLERNDELSFQSDRGSNLVIEGDNLQVMVSLRTQYAESVDVIYIDPPYNRGGNDFRYSDARFQDPDADGSDSEYVSNVDGGRHTKWLNYMAPRLVAMKSLMSENGVIFVSINDIELGRLLMLMDEIFDEKNRIGVITWRGSADNNPSRIQIEHEYVICYAKNVSQVAKAWTTPADEMKETLLEQFEELLEAEPDPEKRAKAWASLVRANGESLGRLKAYSLVDEHGPYQSARRVHNPKKGGYQYGVTKNGVVDSVSRWKARSSADWKRWSGSFSRQRRTMSSSPRGQSSVWASAGSSLSAAFMVSMADSRAKARLPVSISKSSAPKAKMSERWSTTRPRTASGDM